MLAEEMRKFHHVALWTRPHRDHSIGVAQCQTEETAGEVVGTQNIVEYMVIYLALK